MIVTERIRMARLLNHISRQPEYAEKIGITLETNSETLKMTKSKEVKKNE